ncbi:MAG: ABC transporter ATP-binding protein [Solirubrobacteraceae bacterium]
MSDDDGRLAAVPRTELDDGQRYALETVGLTKRYRRATALSDCTVSVPQGRISALVGPNGAGKSTLLRLLTGLAWPTGGSALVLGGTPRQDQAFLAEIGYLAQDVPLYRRLSAEDHIRAGANLNRRWDGAAARTRLRELGVPLNRAVGTLSGGQRAQVGLSLALAKRPRLLLLDEPVAALDPLARRHFLSTLTTAMVESEEGLTVVLSSHLIADLERVCDYLIVLGDSRVQVAGEVDELLASHHRLIGPRRDPSNLPGNQQVIEASHTDRSSTLLIRTEDPILDPAWTVEKVSLDDLVLAYMGHSSEAKQRAKSGLEVQR